MFNCIVRDKKGDIKYVIIQSCPTGFKDKTIEKTEEKIAEVLCT